MSRSWEMLRISVALIVVLVVVGAPFLWAQTLGNAPQLNVAVQGQTGAQPEGAFFNFINLTQMQVDTNVDESDISQARVGQDATFTVDAYPGTTFRATVTQIRKAAINVQNVVRRLRIIYLGVKNPLARLSASERFRSRFWECSNPKGNRPRDKTRMMSSLFQSPLRRKKCLADRWRARMRSPTS